MPKYFSCCLHVALFTLAVSTDNLETVQTKLERTSSDDIVGNNLTRLLSSNTAHSNPTVYAGRGGRWEAATCEDLGWNRSLMKRKVIDAFAFNGEDDMFEARRLELGPVINGSAIVRTSTNFHGIPHDVTVIPSTDRVRDVLLSQDAFGECVQRDDMDAKCALAIAKNAVAEAVELFDVEPEDWVIFGDVDEIPNREAVRILHECEVPVGPTFEREIIRLNCIGHYMYSTQCRIKESSWTPNSRKTPVFMKVATMQKYGLRAMQARGSDVCRLHGKYATCQENHGMRPIALNFDNAAWHLSSFGGADAVAKKVQDNADNAIVADEEAKARCEETNADRSFVSWGRSKPYTSYPEVPHSVADDPRRFESFFGDADAIRSL